MPIIVVQVRPFDRDDPGCPWAAPSHGLSCATGDEMMPAMNAVGVDAAVKVSSYIPYRYDPSYALEVYRKYPEKFRIVTPVDATDPAIDGVVARWAASEGARGIRINLGEGMPMEPDHRGLSRELNAAARHGLRGNLLCWGRLDKGVATSAGR